MRKNPLLYITAFIFLLLCILVRIPFYTHFFVPEFDPDTFDYFNYSYLINSGSWHQIGNLPMDLPPGFPAFISFISLFTHHLIAIALIQLLIYLAVCIILLFELRHWGKIIFLLGAAGLLLYSINSYTISYESALLTESLYTSALILLATMVFKAIRSPSKTNVAILGVAIILPSLFRPTGLSMYFIAIPLAIYFYKKVSGRLAYFIAGLLLLLLVWGAWNYCISGIFIPGNFKRVFSATHINVPAAYREPVYENLRAKNGIVMEDKGIDTTTAKSRTEDYLKQISQKVPNFYSSLLPTRIKRFYIYNLPTLPQFDYMYNGEMQVPLTLKEYTYRDFIDMPQKNRVNGMLDALKFENCKRNKFILLYSVFNKAENILIRNKIFYLLIIFSFIACLGLCFTPAIELKEFFVFLVPILMLFFSIMIGIEFGGFLYRYGHVAIFIIYLMPCLYAVLLQGLSGKTVFSKK